jgi:hypothetical protein
VFLAGDARTVATAIGAFIRLTLAVLSLGTIVAFGASGPVDATLTPTTRGHCHVVRFPQGWKIPNVPEVHQPLFYGYDSLYEFRVPGPLETTFLLAGIVLPSKKYTINQYKVDMSDPAGVAQPATAAEWQDGTKIPDSRPSDWRTFANVHLTGNTEPLPFRGFHLVKSGDIWPGEYARLSPDQRWIVLLSSSGNVAKRDEFLTFGGRDQGKLFFDVYNADTGNRLITIVATYRDVEPGHAINQSLWVTERYFIVPLGDHRERCLVCDFGRASRSGGLKP